MIDNLLFIFRNLACFEEDLKFFDFSLVFRYHN